MLRNSILILSLLDQSSIFFFIFLAASSNSWAVIPCVSIACFLAFSNNYCSVLSVIVWEQFGSPASLQFIDNIRFGFKTITVVYEDSLLLLAIWISLACLSVYYFKFYSLTWVEYCGEIITNCSGTAWYSIESSNLIIIIYLRVLVHSTNVSI